MHHIVLREQDPLSRVRHRVISPRLGVCTNRRTRGRNWPGRFAVASRARPRSTLL